MFTVTLERAAAWLLIIANIQIHSALSQVIVQSTECICPGRELRLECTVVGGFSTIWKGMAVDCPSRGNEIVLPHARFETPGVEVTDNMCSNGMITGHSLNRTFDDPNSTFTSQLVIHLPLLNDANNTLDGRTVECTRDGVGVIGNHTIAYGRASDALPPSNVRLSQVAKNALTFQWNPVQLFCSYQINTEGCGVCPNTTLNTSITCVVNDMPANSNSSNSVCTLSVETTVCGFQSNSSETATAILRAPNRPVISKVLPFYSSTSRHLTKVDVQVDYNEERFNISDGFESSVTSYIFTIAIGFPGSESTCGSPPIVTLLVSSCMAGVCNTTLTLPPCDMHPSQAEVVVHASNGLRDGLPSTAPLNTLNSLFFVEFEPLSHSFSCRFVEFHENKSCEVTYGPMDPTDQLCTLDNRTTLENNNENMISNTVNVFIPAVLTQQLYCFTAIGQTPTFTIAVEGTFTIADTSGNGNTTLIVVVVVAVISFVIMLLMVALIIALSIIISKKKHTLKQREYTSEDEQQYDRTTFAQRQHRLQAPLDQQKADEQQYDQTFHAQQKPQRQVPVHSEQADEQQYDQIFIQQQSRQPIAKQQVMIYSELGPTVTGKNNDIFVSRGDDRIEYAELDHRRARHVPASDSTTKVATTCLTTPDHEAGNFDVREDSPSPPPLPPKYNL